MAYLQRAGPKPTHPLTGNSVCAAAPVADAPLPEHWATATDSAGRTYFWCATLPCYKNDSVCSNDRTRTQGVLDMKVAGHLPYHSVARNPGLSHSACAGTNRRRRYNGTVRQQMLPNSECSVLWLLGIEYVQVLDKLGDTQVASPLSTLLVSCCVHEFGKTMRLQVQFQAKAWSVVCLIKRSLMNVSVLESVMTGWESPVPGPPAM